MIIQSKGGKSCKKPVPFTKLKALNKQKKGSLFGLRNGVKLLLSRLRPLSGILMPRLHFTNSKGFPSNGCEAPPCWNASTVNCVANSVRLFPLAAPSEQRWLSTSKFSVFMLNGIIPLGGRLPTLSPLTCSKSTTLRDGYGIKQPERQN